MDDIGEYYREKTESLLKQLREIESKQDNLSLDSLKSWREAERLAKEKVSVLSQILTIPTYFIERKGVKHEHGKDF